ncbi:hypothetical protein [Chryseobacterium sp. ISL-6]|uniref:hypothetical protein n=1 Tax=Chryseobacterium sp. ISL-6 TaxID=2819143 RepID=UPI001BE676AF|nr:hypothetical protein [Chryseobacterium sp. ISL-6]MBT2620175.1 hypothetical protein [Chryseobacterium sp. ISL-6]
MKPKKIPGIPLQKEGGFHDTESQKYYNDAVLAAEKFSILKERFFSVNQWQQFSGENTSDFKLFDSNGKPLDRSPEIGDFIRINIPGPGEAEAKGYDWVEIVNIFHQVADEFESFLVTCSPSKIPGNDQNDHVAHFYSDKATSTFLISRNGKELTAAIYGRNESPNYNAAFVDKLRNMMIGLGGMVGISKIQWKALSDGLLDFE